MFQKAGILIMTIIILWSSFYYVQASENKQVVLILIDDLSFIDSPIYKQLHGFDQLEKKAAKGAMNINSGGSRTLGNSYLSIGSGGRANGLEKLGQFYNQSSQGIVDKLVVKDVDQLDQVQQKFKVEIGALGEILNQSGFSSWVFGNSDTDVKRSYAPLITMDNQGVSYGKINEQTLLLNRNRPHGIKTNYDYLLEKFRQSKEEMIELTVFELGDIFRLNEATETDKKFKEQSKYKIYQEMGAFIYSVMENIEENHILIVASPMVSSQAKIKGYMLAPVWIYQKNIDANLLTSNTTKRSGIIANIDITPTILQILNISETASGMMGQYIIPIKSNVNLDAEMEHIVNIHKYRASVLYPYVMWQVMVLLFSLTAMLVRGKFIKGAAKLSLASLMFLPILLLTSAFWLTDNMLIYFGLFLITSFGLAWLISFLNPKGVFLIIGLVTFLVISLDVMLDSYLMKRSFLGYDPIIGARYYGIGNEYMGIYIGAGMLFTAAFLQVKKNKLTAILTIGILAIMTLLLLLPTMGTNAGGAISAIFASGYMTFKLLNIRWDKKGVFIIIAFITIGFSILILTNYIVNEDNQSHIGRALNQLFNGDLSSIFLIISRKLSMNIKLLKVSSWSKVIVTSVIAIGIFYLKNNFVPLKNKYSYLFYGFYGILVGAVVSFFVNDSGVVSAATMIVYVAIPIIYLAINEQQQEL